MRFAPAMMALSLLSMRFGGEAHGGPVPAKEDVDKAIRDGAFYARKLGGGSGGGFKNRAFCAAMAARALPPLWKHYQSTQPRLEIDWTFREWRKTKNALKRQRRKMRNL